PQCSALPASVAMSLKILVRSPPGLRTDESCRASFSWPRARSMAPGPRRLTHCVHQGPLSPLPIASAIRSTSAGLRSAYSPPRWRSRWPATPEKSRLPEWLRHERRWVPRHEVVYTGRGTADDYLDVVGEAVVAVGGVQLRHRQQVLKDVLRQAPRPQLLVTPLPHPHVLPSDPP